jgi:NOL1/NOP2/sun family putative RNA methylase
MSITPLPEIFVERLKEIIPPKDFDGVFNTFGLDRQKSYRINTIKSDGKDVFKQLEEKQIIIKPLSWMDEGFLIEHELSPEQQEFLSQLADKGLIYKQNISSMLIPVILNPQPGERVFDMCAAPGSKTSQMAMMMKNQGKMVAVEAIKDRFYKLKAVLTLLGVKNVETVFCDGRKFRLRLNEELFDKVLIDAPCSSEGRFNINNKKSLGYWSLRKIKEMVQKQRGILLNGTRLLKKGGTLVYSTCTFSPEENEAIVTWVLKKNDVIRLVPVDVPKIKTYPPLLQWQGKSFSPNVAKCVRILPTEMTDGFFIAKFHRQ